MESLKVLVVDDELGMRQAMARTLERFTITFPDMEGDFSFLPVQAESGERALELLTAERPDILLLDHKLPGMSGLDVLNQMREQGNQTLTVMVTAYASLETAIIATKRGAYDFLAKPFTPEELKTAIRKATKHLLLARQARRLAEEKRQVRFQFISVLAHELKAPLGAVEGFLNILRDPSMVSDAETHAHMVDRALIRLGGMRKLIIDLLDLTRIESGQKQRELLPTDLVEVAKAAIESAMPDADPRKIQIALEAPSTLVANVDRAEMEIVFNNLVSNAVKYNRDAGHVLVHLALENGVVTIAVKDTGIGLTPEEASRLFKEFTRIKNEKTRTILGSGLGLSIVKKIASMYAGDASVSSVANEGSTFTVVLKPAVAALSARPS